jgi:hypothetical protein
VFEHFDFSILNDPGFKEDAVREELIAPLLRGLGYGPSGDPRVVRSKSLTHPFVMIGSKRHPVVIVPDYTLIVGEKPVLILDAKAPREPVVQSVHVEQVYSYAIHPDIRCRQFALCNGEELALYSISASAPVFRVRLENVGRQWDDVVTALGPRFLEDPELREFFPDYGTTVTRLGLDSAMSHVFVGHYLQNLLRVSDDLYTGSATTYVGSLECLIAFDFSKETLDSLLSGLPADLVAGVRARLSQQPFEALLNGQVVLTCEGVLGAPIRGPYETFIPIQVNEILAAHHDPSISLEKRPSRFPGGV